MSDNPPIGYLVGGTGAVWNTDLETVTSPVLTGDSCVRFNKTAPGDNFYLYQEIKKPCAGNDLFRVSGWTRADGTTDTTFLYINWYTSADVYISQQAIFSAPVTVANTWELKSGVVQAPSNAGGFIIFFGRDNGNTDYVYWDSAFVEAVDPAFSSYLTSTTGYATAATVVFDNDSTNSAYDFGGNYAAGTGIFTAPSDGLYEFSAELTVQSLSNGKWAYIDIYDSTAGQLLAHGPSQTNWSGGAYSLDCIASSGPVWLAAGKQVLVAVYHNEGSNRNVYGHATIHYAYFRGAKIR